MLASLLSFMLYINVMYVCNVCNVNVYKCCIYIYMLYIVLAYLMLFAALTNAVCLYNASFLPLISANAFYFHALSLFIYT